MNAQKGVVYLHKNITKCQERRYKVPKKLTKDEYELRFKEADKDKEYELNTEYTGSKNAVSVTHKVCGKTWNVIAENFIRGTRCPTCTKKVTNEKVHNIRANTHESFVNYMQITVGDEYTVIGSYYNTSTPIEIRHNECGTLYKVRPNDFKNGKRCPKCAIVKRAKKTAKTTKQFSQEIFELTGDEYILLGEYVNWHTNVKMQHSVCGNVWYADPNSFLRGSRCPKCVEPRGERFIREYLEKYSINFVSQKKFSDLKVKRSLSYDFLLPDSKILIEYQGGQHFYPVELFGGEKKFKEQQEHDRLKRKYAKENGYILLELNYKLDSYDKVENFLINNLSDM